MKKKILGTMMLDMYSFLRVLEKYRQLKTDENMVNMVKASLNTNQLKAVVPMLFLFCVAL